MRKILERTRLSLAKQICGPIPPLLSGRIGSRLYPDRLARDYPLVFTVRSRTGGLFRHTTGEYHAKKFAIHRYHDWRIWAVAIALCSKGDAIVEVGANIGTETVAFADIVGPTGSVIAFEPFQPNFKVLENIVAMNHYKHVSLKNIALSNRAQTTSFATPSNLFASGVGYLEPSPRNALRGSIKVECDTLDAQVRFCPRLAVIDVEGAELQVLQGGKRLISQTKPVVIIEVGPTQMSRYGVRAAHLVAFLRCNGYACYRLVPRTVRLEAVPENYEPRSTENWVCLGEGVPSLLKRIQTCVRKAGLMPCVPKINPLYWSHHG